MVIAPSYPMLRDATRATFLQLARRGGILADFNVSANIGTLSDGKQVTFRSADNPDSLRGPNLDWFYMDEAAMCKEEAWLIMIGRLRGSGNIDKSHLRGWLTTTPRGRNWVWREFAREFTQTSLGDHEIIKANTQTNTYLPDDFVAAIKASYSEKWQLQELEGEFVEFSGGVFRNVRPCATDVKLERGLPDRQYVMGVDWARSNDSTVISVMDSAARRQVALDRFTGIGYELQLSRLRAMFDRFNPVSIIAEYNSMGGPLVERIQAMGLPVQGFTTNNASKAQIIEALALAFERGDIAILADETQISELQSYEQERLPSGLIRYGAPDGMHDDTVIALALAWYGVSGGGNGWANMARAKLQEKQHVKAAQAQ